MAWLRTLPFSFHMLRPDDSGFTTALHAACQASDTPGSGRVSGTTCALPAAHSKSGPLRDDRTREDNRMTDVATGLRVRPGSRFPLGATWDGIGTNFALFSQHATQVELCLFDEKGQNERCVPLREVTAHVWHGYLPRSEE